MCVASLCVHAYSESSLGVTEAKRAVSLGDRSDSNAASRNDKQAGYPPYNIELLAEDKYRISMAVAGFSQEEINIEAHVCAEELDVLSNR